MLGAIFPQLKSFEGPSGRALPHASALNYSLNYKANGNMADTCIPAPIVSRNERGPVAPYGHLSAPRGNLHGQLAERGGNRALKSRYMPPSSQASVARTAARSAARTSEPLSGVPATRNESVRMRRCARSALERGATRQRLAGPGKRREVERGDHLQVARVAGSLAHRPRAHHEAVDAATRRRGNE